MEQDQLSDITITTLVNQKIAMVYNGEKNLGCLYEEDAFIPNMFGTIVYFKLSGDIEEKLQNLKKLGGKVLSRKQRIQTLGYQLLIEDSEGNRIAIYKDKD